MYIHICVHIHIYIYIHESCINFGKCLCTIALANKQTDIGTYAHTCSVCLVSMPVHVRLCV